MATRLPLEGEEVGSVSGFLVLHAVLPAAGPRCDISKEAVRPARQNDV